MEDEIVENNCRHLRVFFGSGGFYIFCENCDRSWVACFDGGSKLNYDAGRDGMDNEFRVEEKKEDE